MHDSTSQPPSMTARWAQVRNPLWTAAALVIVVAGLKEAQSILLPIIISITLAIICSPAVNWLERRRVPTVIAVLLVVAGLMALLTGVGALVGSSASDFREAIPTYQKRIVSMANGVFSWAQARGLPVDHTRILEVIEPGAAASKAMGFVGSSVNALAAALSNTILVVLTMILILMEGATVPGKLRAISGHPEADISHFQRIASDVQSYLFIKTILGIVTGALIAAWAAILGVDFPLLWGLIAFLLNYIPNIGSILAAIPACLLALIQLGPGSALALGAGYVAVNMVLGNVIEPMWMGRKLGLSTVVVFLSLVVWGWIWGPAGMLLSVPLTMIIKIMLEDSPDYHVVALLLDTGEADPPSTRRSQVEVSDPTTEGGTSPSQPPPSAAGPATGDDGESPDEADKE
ncbi:MAG: AI-2E family transporter [Polyangiaceae bacterium]